MQQVQEGRDKNFSFLCIRRHGADESLRIGTDEMRDATAPRPHRFAIATDITKYERQSNLDGRDYEDVYVVDLQSGKRIPTR